MPRPLARRVLQGIAGLASPNAASAAADVWNSGHFPGETDFRYTVVGATVAATGLGVTLVPQNKFSVKAASANDALDARVAATENCERPQTLGLRARNILPLHSCPLLAGFGLKCWALRAVWIWRG